MNVAFSYYWLLPSGDHAQVRASIEALRLHAIDLGSEVGDVIVLTGDDAQAVQPEARHVVMFTATIPGATEGRYGLAAAGNFSDPIPWSWKGVVVVVSVKNVSELHAAAANLGIEVVEEYAGMIFTSRKDALGVIEVEQRQAFDWTDF